MDSTLAYYNDNAEKFFQDTVAANMMPIYEHFTKYLSPKSHILDLGCGSGRDTKYFRSINHTVTPVDGSFEMCKLAEDYLKGMVLCVKFNEIDFCNEFDAIWACSSLLHVPYEEMGQIMNLLVKGCKNNAIIYTCFKYGNSYSYKDGRLFSNYTEKMFQEFLLNCPKVALVEQWMSYDVRGIVDRPQWLNVILRVIK